MKEGWQVKKLWEVCDFLRGLTYAKSDEVDVSNNIVLRATNIDLETNLLDLAELKYINDAVSVPAGKKVKKGSLLICTASGSKSHLGKVALIDDDYDFAFGGFMGMLTPRSEIDSKFLFHLMTSGAYKDFIAALSDGANINNLKFSDLQRFDVPAPPLPEQQRLVALLDGAFEAIATAKAHAEQNLKNARALFESQLDAVFRQRGEGWIETTLNDVASIRNGFAFKSIDFSENGPTKSIKITNVGVREFVETSDSGLPAKFAEKFASVSAPAGSLVIALTRTIIADGLKVAIVPPAYDQALVNQRVAALLPKSEQVSASYLFAYLSTSIVLNYVKERVNTLMQPNLSINDLRIMPIPLPPTNERERIVDTLLAFQEESQRLEALYRRKIAALDELKASLLHKAFAGEL